MLDPELQPMLEHEPQPLQLKSAPDNTDTSSSIPVCPAADMGEPTFTLFSELPFDLREMIWKLSSPPRVIQVSCEDYNSATFKVGFTTPIISRVTRESRGVFLRQYRLMKGGSRCYLRSSAHAEYLEKPVYIDTSKDTILSMNQAGLYALADWLHPRLVASAPGVVDTLQHVIYNVQLPGCFVSIFPSIMRFPALKALLLPHQIQSDAGKDIKEHEKGIAAQINNGYDDCPQFGSSSAKVLFVEQSEIDDLIVEQNSTSWLEHHYSRYT